MWSEESGVYSLSPPVADSSLWEGAFAPFSLPLRGNVINLTDYKSFASLFKGCGVPGQRPGSRSAERETLRVIIPPQGVNSKTVRWTVFEEGTPWERGRPLVAARRSLPHCRKAVTENLKFMTLLSGGVYTIERPSC